MIIYMLLQSHIFDKFSVPVSPCLIRVVGIVVMI